MNNIFSTLSCAADLNCQKLPRTPALTFLKPLAFLFVILVDLLLPSPAASQPNVEWEKYDEGIETADVTVNSNVLFSASVFFVRASLQTYYPAVIRVSDVPGGRSDVRSIVEKNNTFFGINGSFFDEKGEPLGLLINRGIMRHAIHRGGQTLTGIFATTRSGMRIFGRTEFNPTSIVDALQAGPRLLIQGTKVKGYRDTSYSKRSGVCLDHAGRIVFFCTSRGLLGLTLEQIQSLISSPGVGCVDALNLDGGRSSQLFLKSPSGESGAPATDIQGDDAVPVVISLFSRGMDEEKVQ